MFTWTFGADIELDGYNQFRYQIQIIHELKRNLLPYTYTEREKEPFALLQIEKSD